MANTFLERYLSYLTTDEWKVRRVTAIERAGGACQICNGTKSLQAHHRTYANFGNEHDGDLTVLCNLCHGLFTSHKRMKLLELPVEESSELLVRDLGECNERTDLSENDQSRRVALLEEAVYSHIIDCVDAAWGEAANELSEAIGWERCEEIEEKTHLYAELELTRKIREDQYKAPRTLQSPTGRDT